MGAELILEIQKWGVLGGIMCLITFMVILNNEKSMEGTLPDKMYFWLFTFLCWVIMLFTSKLLTDKDDDDESFLDTAPKHFMSLIWFTYMVSIHVGIAANPGNKGFKNPFSVSPVGGGKRGGKKGGSSGYQVQLGPMTDVAKHLIVMGIIMALINSFSYLWLYGRCKSEVNDSNMLKQIHGAQINIIVIGVVAIAIYILRTAKGGE